MYSLCVRILFSYICMALPFNVTYEFRLSPNINTKALSLHYYTQSVRGCQQMSGHSVIRHQSYYVCTHGDPNTIIQHGYIIQQCYQKMCFHRGWETEILDSLYQPYIWDQITDISFACMRVSLRVHANEICTRTNQISVSAYCFSKLYCPASLLPGAILQPAIRKMCSLAKLTQSAIQSLSGFFQWACHQPIHAAYLIRSAHAHNDISGKGTNLYYTYGTEMLGG